MNLRHVLLRVRCVDGRGMRLVEETFESGIRDVGDGAEFENGVRVFATNLDARARGEGWGKFEGHTTDYEGRRREEGRLVSSRKKGRKQEGNVQRPISTFFGRGMSPLRASDSFLTVCSSQCWRCSSVP
jgi:hypothetical protein